MGAIGQDGRDCSCTSSGVLWPNRPDPQAPSHVRPSTQPPTCLEPIPVRSRPGNGARFPVLVSLHGAPSPAPIITRAWNPVPRPSPLKLPKKRSHRQGWTGPLSIRGRVRPAPWQARTDERRKGQGRPVDGQPRRRPTFVDRLESVPWLEAVFASGPVASSLAQHHGYTLKMIAALATGVGK
jgi:hypothetical protein